MNAVFLLLLGDSDFRAAGERTYCLTASVTHDMSGVAESSQTVEMLDM